MLKIVSFRLLKVECLWTSFMAKCTSTINKAFTFTVVLACKMFTSGFRPSLKNVACLSSLLFTMRNTLMKNGSAFWNIGLKNIYLFLLLFNQPSFFSSVLHGIFSSQGLQGLRGMRGRTGPQGLKVDVFPVVLHECLDTVSACSANASGRCSYQNQ